MLNFRESQLSHAVPQIIEVENTKITINTEYGQKQTPILRLPKSSLGQMMSTYQYQFEIQQNDEKQIEAYLYILKEHNLNLFKSTITLDREVSREQQEKLQQLAFDNYQMEDDQNQKTLGGKDNEQSDFKINNISTQIKTIEKVREAKFPRFKTMKVSLDIKQSDNGFHMIYLITQQDQETEVGFALQLEDITNKKMEIEPKQVQKSKKLSVQSQSSFPQMKQSHKKERVMEQNFGFQNSSFFISNDTMLLREIEKYSQDSSSNFENKPHNLRRRKLTNYSTMGQEDEDDSTCENSSEPGTPTQNKQKKQNSRKSSHNIISTNNNNIITIQNSNFIPQTLFQAQSQQSQQVQIQQQSQQLSLNNISNNNSINGNKKSSPLKTFSNLGNFSHSHIEEDDSYTAQSSTQVSHKSSASKKKGDKKNVVKNFTKAFSKFVTNDDYSEDIQRILGTSNTMENFRAQWKEFFYKPKFNNKLIKELILNQKFHDVFDLFLQQHAYDWLLNQSSVEDKESHLEVLRDYIKASSKPQEIENIVILKCRN